MVTFVFFLLSFNWQLTSSFLPKIFQHDKIWGEDLKKKKLDLVTGHFCCWKLSQWNFMTFKLQIHSSWSQQWIISLFYCIPLIFPFSLAHIESINNLNRTKLTRFDIECWFFGSWTDQMFNILYETPRNVLPWAMDWKQKTEESWKIEFHCRKWEEPNGS